MGWTRFFYHFYYWRYRWIFAATFLQQITSRELKQIKGGATSSISSIINAIVKAAAFLFDLGRNTGSAIRRAQTKKWC